MKKIKDFYYYRAKKENYPARSIYKLREIDEKYHILKPGYKVLDLGCSPGSWTKYCSEKIGDKGLVVGVDKQEFKMPELKNIIFIKEDIFKMDIGKIQHILPSFDVVLSDMAPSTTGIREVDQARSLELAGKAFFITQKVLRKGGSFVCKVFQGPDIKNFIEKLKTEFQFVKTIKPAGSRKESFETFILALNKAIP